MNLRWQEMTAHDALEQWDKNEPVWSIEMGGLGPGYEQCLQMLAFELLRVMLDSPPKSWDAVSGSDGDHLWQEYQKQIHTTPSVKKAIHQLGPTGAQVGAAMHVAQMFARNDYAKALEMAKEDRRIMVQKHFPTMEDTDGKKAS